MGYAFISYSTKNQVSADVIRDLLSENGIETWMAPGDIPAGSRYAMVISRAVKECACFILVLSNDAQNSIWVAKEVERALNYRKPIIPVQIEDVVLNDEFELYISTNQIVAVKINDRDSAEINKLLAGVTSFTGIPQSVHDPDSDIISPINESTINESMDENHFREYLSSGFAMRNDQEHAQETTKLTDTAADVQNGSEDEKNNLILNNKELEAEHEESQCFSETRYEALSIDDENINPPKSSGHLVSSYRRVIDMDRRDCICPIEIRMPDEAIKIFDFCDEFSVSDQRKYIVVRQKIADNNYQFFVFRSSHDKKTLISEGREQKKVYRWFREKHRADYVFADDTAVVERKKKKKHFAQDTAILYFKSSEDIPQVLRMPDKYAHINSHVFSKLNLQGKSIRQILIPNSVVEIEDEAFFGLIVTEAVFIPSSVKHMGKNSFTLASGAYIYCYGCCLDCWQYDGTNGIKVIEDIPFKAKSRNYASIIEELYDANGVTRIKSSTLPYANPAPSVDVLAVPSSVCVLDEGALCNAIIQNKIILPDTVTQIGENAFQLDPKAYVECSPTSYSYYYCSNNGIRNSVDIYRSMGRCTYCGGRLVGLFKRKCSCCGKEKDY